MGNTGYLPLFETKKFKGSVIYRLFAVSVFAGICLILVYRFSHIPRGGADGRWVCIGLFAAELWFSLYWICTQVLRWNRVSRCTFKDRLSQRYEDDLPRVDVFVCTADPKIEPPQMVINTVLSVLAYDYPPEKLSVYLSDDAGSDITFYALLEASYFAKAWIPHCKKFRVEPRSPEAYFLSIPDVNAVNEEFVAIKKLYEEMENRIKRAVNQGRLSEEQRSTHKGYSQWDTYSSIRDHDTILQILTDGRDSNAGDIEGCSLPTLVYLAREKRPKHPHNFKAGAMNALIRVSGKISNGQIIHNVDCDMYSNDSQSVRDALCFFMDENRGQEVAFVQFSQAFSNVTKNEIYGSSFRVGMEVEFHGMDGLGGPPYIGTGCFHKRDALCGRTFNKKSTYKWHEENDPRSVETLLELEAKSKVLASCTYEECTEWGKETGLKYGCPVEDVITGLSIQCKGWRSVYFNPKRKAFVGVAPITLPQTLVQHVRWAEGNFLILLSKYSPAWYALGKISFGLQVGYCVYSFWAPSCLPTLYYSIIPSFYLLKSTPLFPQSSSLWFVPFAYVISAKYFYSLVEFLWSGGTIPGWWNEQRIWLYKRTSSYLFGLIDAILKSAGLCDQAFVITAKVADKDVSARYQKEMLEFGDSSPMFTILTTLAGLNLFCFLGVVKTLAMDASGVQYLDTMALQIVLCAVMVLINWPLYQGLFFRQDRGKMPFSLTLQSIGFTLLVCTCFRYFH